MPVAAILTLLAVVLHDRASDDARAAAVHEAALVSSLAIDAHFEDDTPTGEDRADVRRQLRRLFDDQRILGLQIVSGDGSTELSFGDVPTSTLTNAELRDVAGGGDPISTRSNIGGAQGFTVAVAQEIGPPRATVVTMPWSTVASPIDNSTVRIVIVMTLLGAGALVAVVLVRRSMRKREERSLHDPMTGLPNRRALLDWLDEARRSEGKLVVTVVGINGMREIAEAFGQEFADQVLVEVYERLQAAVPTATVTRLEADELGGFATVDASLSMDALLEELDTRLRLLTPPIEIDGRVVVVQGCAGLTIADPDDEPEETIRKARLALSNARRLEQPACQYMPRMLDELTDRLALERDFERALSAGEFELYYQPIVDITDSRPVSVEALVRWRHPERGLLKPAAFVEIAEAAGFIVPLGSWIFSESCRQVQLWRTAHPRLRDLTLHVNVSPRQLAGHYFAAHVRGVLAETGLPPRCVTVEVTESTTTDAHAKQRLHDLHELGVQIAIDDFGTGYSSLAYFDDLPIDAIKIDKRFVDGIDSRTDRTTIAALITRLAHQFGLPTVAEGVERPEQLETLRALGCTHAQGYLFARQAAAPEALAALIGLGAAARATHEDAEPSAVRFALGPLPSAHARAWITYARGILAEVDSGLDLSPGALAVVAHYLDSWELAATSTKTFEWEGSEDASIVWSVLRTWYAIAEARAAIADEIGAAAVPAGAAVFEEELLGVMLRALAAHDLDSVVGTKPIPGVERSWPPSAIRRPR